MLSWICTGLERNPHFHLKPCISFETGANSLFQFLHVSRIPFFVVLGVLLEPFGTLWGSLWSPWGLSWDAWGSVWSSLGAVFGSPRHVFDTFGVPLILKTSLAVWPSRYSLGGPRTPFLDLPGAPLSALWYPGGVLRVLPDTSWNRHGCLLHGFQQTPVFGDPSRSLATPASSRDLVGTPLGTTWGGIGSPGSASRSLLGLLWVPLGSVFL